MRAFRAVLIGIALLLPASTTAAQQSEFVVVVNADNPLSDLTRESVSKLFLKKIEYWGDGATVAPVDLPESSPTRAAFSKRVHKRSVGAIRAFWQQQLFAARAIPPIEKASDAEVLAYVRENPSAIGYVTPEATLGSGIRAVRVSP